MIRTRDGAEDAGILNERHQCFVHEKVVKPPANIARAGVRAVGPPRIGFLIGVQGTKAIYESVLQPPGQGLAFLGQEPGGLFVLRRPRQVDRLMGGIEISADNEPVPLRLKASAMSQQGI